MLIPLFNKCLIKIIDDYENIVRPDTEEHLQKGTLMDFHLVEDHLTASTGYKIQNLEVYERILKDRIGKVVYYEKYADSGSVIEQEDGKYALVPFYRVITVEVK